MGKGGSDYHTFQSSRRDGVGGGEKKKKKKGRLGEGEAMRGVGGGSGR